jgi:DNA-binding transcriptional ArsR family regulator
MARSRPQSAIRYPLTGILGTDANVRVLRELSRHGSELAASALVMRSGLAQSSVREALIALENMGVVEAIGSGRSRLYRLRRNHPLRAILNTLFKAEEERFDAILEAIRMAAEHCGKDVIAVWLYGSVARGQDRPVSDIDLAVVADPKALPRVEQTMRDELHRAQDKLAFVASVVALDLNDVQRLSDENDPWWTAVSRDAFPIVGDRPDGILARLRRTRKLALRNAS